MSKFKWEFPENMLEVKIKADNGDAEAQFTFANYILKDENFSFKTDLTAEQVEMGIHYLRLAAAQNHFYGNAACDLGDMYCNYYSALVPVDYAKAKMWYKTAIMGGIPHATYMLGECAYYGWGENVNYEKAAKCYFETANRLIDGLVRLADMYVLGEYFPFDLDFALKLYNHVLKKEENLYKRFGFYSDAYKMVRNRLDNIERKPPIFTGILPVENDEQLKMRKTLLQILEKQTKREGKK
ncbi:MAG: hypothetical protein FWG64_11020 [Firmicutes bacterium]|nr:hypothetical protein [Bacillota bacterium]